MILIPVALLLAMVWIAWIYNSLVSLHNRADAAWADIDVQLGRRYDLVPNLVAIVKGYAAHEATTFENVAAARCAALEAFTPAEKNRTEPTLSQGLRSIVALAEGYPELKANEEFLRLQQSLTDTENSLQTSRRDYNAVVRDLSIRQQQFPNNLLAPLFGLKPREYFQLNDPLQTQAGRVDLGDRM